jgi:cytochrome c oxidase subunit 4
MAHGTGSLRTYFIIYVLLLLFTGLTVLLATVGHLGVWEVPAALTIATCKTVLVGLFFMHLLQSPRLTWLIVATGALFVAIMIVLTMADYATRGWAPTRPLQAADQVPRGR